MRETRHLQVKEGIQNRDEKEKDKGPQEQEALQYLPYINLGHPR